MSNNPWNLDALNKAYQEGYYVGLTAKNQHGCPYAESILEAAWEAGWEDGNSAIEERLSATKAIPLRRTA